MNKSELIDAIAHSADLSKAGAARALDAILGSITTELKKGGEVTLVGFGAFKVTSRAARKGRNPQTGKEIMIKATKAPVFRAGKPLKDLVHKPAKK